MRLASRLGTALLLAAALGAPRAASAVTYRQLTALGDGWYDAGFGDPVWSPDGARVAFTFAWIEPGHWYFLFAYVGIVDAASGSAIPFESQWPPCSYDTPIWHPSWSPDGDRIVYACGATLWIGAVAETLQTQLVGAYGQHPAWSPDGARIAFDGGGIWTIPAAGGAALQLTSGLDFQPAWSPDGRSIVYASAQGGQSDLWIVPASGGEPRRLTDDAAADRAPSWSPDGALVAFESERDGDTDVWVVRVSNGALSRLTREPGFDGDPAWSPDGSQIVFVSGRSGHPDLWIASDLRTIAVQSTSWTAIKQLYR